MTLSHPRQSNGILRYDTTKHKLAKYFHAAAFIPTKYTFITATNQGQFTSWLGLSANLISKKLPQTPFMVKGRLDQEQNNLCSNHSLQGFLGDVHHKQEQRTHNILAAIINVNSATAKSYYEQLGRFPVLSSRGNQYIFVLYN